MAHLNNEDNTLAKVSFLGSSPNNSGHFAKQEIVKPTHRMQFTSFTQKCDLQICC